MAHNLNFNKGRYSFASAIQPAWHGLGQILDHRMTAAEAIENANLSFEVEKRPIYTSMEDLKTEQIQVYNRLDVDTHFATIRTDTNEVLGVVGSKYEVVQNKDCFSFFDSIVEEGAAIFETAGVLGKGEKIFLTAKLPEDLIIGNDVIEQYLFLTSSHDGSGAITAAFTPTRIVCANTLKIALGRTTREVNIKHTLNAKIQLAEAATLMQIVTRKGAELEKKMNRFARVRIDDNTLMNLLKECFKPTDLQMEDASKWVSIRAEEVMNYHATHDSQLTRECKGTLYGFVNAVTGFYQNVKTYKSSETKLKSLLDGSAGRHGAKALQLAENYLVMS